MSFSILSLAVMNLALNPSEPNPVMAAVKACDPVALESALQVESPNAADRKDTALNYSIKYCDILISRILLARGADVNLREPVGGFSPLMVATKHQRHETMALLIQLGADANIKSVFGRNALHLSALGGDLVATEMLLTHTNVDVNARGKLCPLAIAMRQKHKQVADAILTLSKTPISAVCLESAKKFDK